MNEEIIATIDQYACKGCIAAGLAQTTYKAADEQKDKQPSFAKPKPMEDRWLNLTEREKQREKHRAQLAEIRTKLQKHNAEREAADAVH